MTITTQTRNTDTRNTDKRFPVVTPAQDTNESGIFCNRKYAEREAAKYNPKVWYLRYPNLPKDEMDTVIAEGIEQARQFVSEAKSEHNFQSVAQWYIQDGIGKLQYEVHQRGREERQAVLKAEEERKRWHELTPLGTALRNTGHRLVDNIRAVEGRYQKRGITWEPLRELLPTPPGYCDIDGDIERDNRGFGREPQYMDGRQGAYSVDTDGNATNGWIFG